MNSKICISVCIVAMLTSSCKKDKVNPDPCANPIAGYVVGYNQCVIGQGFIIALTNSRDTVETFNFPDSVYNFPKNASDEMYSNYQKDFMFSKAYQGKFPV